MSFEAFTFFEIVLAGFVAVWTYRHFSKSKAKISDFEYLGWSAFWGLFIIISYQELAMILHLKDQSLTDLFNNPFATGFSMSILGIAGGICAGFISRDILKNKE